MKRRFLLSLFCLGLTLFSLAQSPFTAGNIVVVRVGDGSAAFDFGTANPVFLEEYTPSGTLVQTIAMPTTGNILTVSGGITGEGYLALSTDGGYLTLAGFNAPAGGSVFSAPNRVIGRVDYNGNINTSTSIPNTGFDDATSAVSDNGTNFWLAGSDGVHYTTLGSTSQTKVVNTNFSTFSQVLTIANGQLYVSNSDVPELATVGTGLPTTAGQSYTGLPGVSSGIAPYQFAFADLSASVSGVDVLYVASQLFSGTGGIKKYSLVGGTWVSNGTVGTTADRYAGLTIKTSGTSVTIFATRKGANSSSVLGGELVTLLDNSGYNGALSGTPTVIASISGADIDKKAFRGVALVPASPAANVSAKIFLQGAYNTGLGRHRDVTAAWASILNANALNQPFNTAAFGNYNGGESVSSGFFTSTGATTDIVDWVLVELRNSSTPATVVARKAAFVREDGQIVGLDGTSPVSFTGVTNGNYYLVIQHRNHLDVRSATTISVNGGSTATYDFTTAQSKAFQDGAITTNPAMKDLGGGVFGLWGGNANSNTNVRFTGLSNDAATILAALSANQAATLTNAYNAADVNMDGTVRYTGLNNDAAALLSILGGNQAAVFTQHQ